MMGPAVHLGARQEWLDRTFELELFSGIPKFPLLGHKYRQSTEGLPQTLPRFGDALEGAGWKRRRRSKTEFVEWSRISPGSPCITSKNAARECEGFVHNRSFRPHQGNKGAPADMTHRQIFLSVVTFTQKWKSSI